MVTIDPEIEKNFIRKLRKVYLKHPDKYQSEEEYWDLMTDHYIAAAALCWKQIPEDKRKKMIESFGKI